MKIDVDLKKSDAEWGKAFDRLGLKGAPVWFEWLGWTLIVGALRYVQMRTHSSAVGVVLGVSGVMFFFHFQAFFHQYAFRNIPYIRSERATRLVSIGVSGLLGMGTWLLLQHVLTILSHQDDLTPEFSP